MVETRHTNGCILKIYTYRATLLDGMNAEFRIEKVFIQIVSTACRYLCTMCMYRSAAMRAAIVPVLLSSRMSVYGRT